MRRREKGSGQAGGERASFGELASGSRLGRLSGCWVLAERFSVEQISKGPSGLGISLIESRFEASKARLVSQLKVSCLHFSQRRQEPVAATPAWLVGSRVRSVYRVGVCLFLGGLLYPRDETPFAERC